MVDRVTGEVRIADLGLAVIEDSHTITETGGIAGTLDYLPPEACHGTTTYPADVFALGATMYAMFTGRKLFAFGSDGRAWLQAMSNYQAPDLSVVPKPEIRDLVSAMIRRDPVDRITMAGVADEFASMLSLTSLFGDKQRQHYRNALSKPNGSGVVHAAGEGPVSTDFSIDVASTGQRHLSLDSASLGYVTGIINSISSKVTADAVPTRLASTATEGVDVDSELPSTPDRETEAAIRSVFLRMNDGRRIGRSLPRRMAATVIANQIAVGAAFIAVLAIAGVAQLVHVRGQRIAQVQSRIADLRSLMTQSSPPSNSQLESAVEQFNESLVSISEPQRAEFIDAVRRSDVMDEYILKADENRIDAIHVKATLIANELATESRNAFKALDGTAKSLDEIALGELQNRLFELFEFDYSPSEEEVTTLLQQCLPESTRGSYTVMIDGINFSVTHNAEVKGLRHIAALFSDLNTELALADGPHEESVQIVAEKLDSIEDHWEELDFRLATAGQAFAKGVKQLPNYIIFDHTGDSPAFRNLVKIDGEANKTIFWKLGRFEFDGDEVLKSVYSNGNQLNLTHHATFADQKGGRIDFSVAWQKDMVMFRDLIMPDSKLVDGLKYKVLSVHLRNQGVCIVFATGLSGFFTIDHRSNSITRFPTKDDLTLSVLLQMKELESYSLDSWQTDNEDIKASMFSADLDKFVKFAGTYALVAHVNVVANFNFTDSLIARFQENSE